MENIQAVRDALEQIENFPEIYTKKIILSMIDADPETGELIITTSINTPRSTITYSTFYFECVSVPSF